MKKKGIPSDKAIIIAVKNNFHGRTITLISVSTDSVVKNNFGPYTPGFKIIPYNDIQAIAQSLKDPNVCGLWMEPIQGEAGVYVPEDGYLKKAELLCKEHNVLLIMDEVQTGIGRTGKMLASDHENVIPDILILGKALGGGIYPVSAVLCRDEIMLTIAPGEHGSTFSGNPMACVIAKASIEVIIDENLIENAEKLGNLFRKHMHDLANKSPLVKYVRGKGLLNAIIIDDSPESPTAWNICLNLIKNGLIARPTHGNIIRLAPPLVINRQDIEIASEIIQKTILL